MTSPPAARPNALPDAAKRAARAEPSRVEVRDADGRLLRLANEEQAERLHVEGAAHWSGYGSRRHLRLTAALAPNSLHTILGRSAMAPSNPMAVYHHNPACRLWPREPRVGPAGPKLPRAEWDGDGG